jgi:hypothetical protein
VDDDFDPGALAIALDAVREQGMDGLADQLADLIIAETARRLAIARCADRAPEWIGAHFRLGTDRFRMTGMELRSSLRRPAGNGGGVAGTDMVLYLASDGTGSRPSLADIRGEVPGSFTLDPGTLDQLVRESGIPAAMLADPRGEGVAGG